jgi:hypothetical protein
MSNLARSYLTSQPAAAEHLLREFLGIRAQKTPEDWFTFSNRSLLGASLCAQKKYAEAEPLLLQGYEGLKAHQTRIPVLYRKRVAEAGARIVELYEAWGHKDKAERWRRELGQDAPDRGFPVDPFAK